MAPRWVGQLGSAESQPDTLAGRARARRWAMLLGRMPDWDRCRVLDLGGSAGMWRSAPRLPAEVVVLNVAEPKGELPAQIRWVVGDACQPPEEVERLIGHGAFDLVFSNSLLEHVGGVAARRQVAAVARRAAPRYWVQTPYRYFPMEPHWLFPGFQFLPLASRSWLARNWLGGHRRAPHGDRERAVDLALGVELISATEMRHLFPDGEVIYERFAAAPKSLIAVRLDGASAGGTGSGQ